MNVNIPTEKPLSIALGKKYDLASPIGPFDVDRFVLAIAEDRASKLDQQIEELVRNSFDMDVTDLSAEDRAYLRNRVEIVYPAEGEPFPRLREIDDLVAKADQAGGVEAGGVEVGFNPTGMIVGTLPTPNLADNPSMQPAETKPIDGTLLVEPGPFLFSCRFSTCLSIAEEVAALPPATAILSYKATPGDDYAEIVIACRSHYALLDMAEKYLLDAGLAEREDCEDAALAYLLVNARVIDRDLKALIGETRPAIVR